MTRSDGGEDPRAEASLTADQRQPADPTRVELQLLAWLAVGDRHRRGRATKPEFEDGESIQRRIGELHALPDQ